MRGFITDYENFALKDGKLLQPGKHKIAVHCRQTRGGQGIDVGVVDVVPAKMPAKR